MYDIAHQHPPSEGGRFFFDGEAFFAQPKIASVTVFVCSTLQNFLMGGMVTLKVSFPNPWRQALHSVKTVVS